MERAGIGLLFHQTPRGIVDADHLVVDTFEVQTVACRVGIRRKHVGVVFCGANASSKDQLDVGPLADHLFKAGEGGRVAGVGVLVVAIIAEDGAGCFGEHEIPDGEVAGVVVHADQQVVGAVVGKRGVEVDVKPSVGVGRDGPGARIDLVVGGEGLGIDGIGEGASRHVFHVDVDVVGIFGAVGVGDVEAKGTDVSGKLNLIRQEKMLGEGVVVQGVDGHLVADGVVVAEGDGLGMGHDGHGQRC